MADEAIRRVKIGDLPAAQALGRTDLLVVQQGNNGFRLPAGDLQDYCKQGVAQHESAAKSAADQAEAAKKAAETAQGKAETAQKAAETAANEVETKAEEVAADAANKAAADVEEKLSGYVSDAQAAQKAAETAQEGAETAASNAADSADQAAAERAAADTAARNAAGYASTANTEKNQAASYSNKAVNAANNALVSANNAAASAEEARAAAETAVGKNINWLATKVVTGDEVIIPESYITFQTTSTMAVANDTGHSLIVGNPYVVTWDGVEYECVCQASVDMGVYIGDGSLIGEPEGTDEPFCVAQWFEGGGYMVTQKVVKVGRNISITGKYTVTYSKLPSEHWPESVPFVILQSSTEGSTKLFKLTVDDTGTLRCTEVADDA